MFVGKDINISSESFISTEQLFSTASTTGDSINTTATTATTATSTAAKKSSPPAHNRFTMNPFSTKSTIRPPNLILSTTAATTATSMSNSHVSGLSW